jgi:hypothetical protein
MTLSNNATDVLRDMQQTIGDANKAKGFHDDAPNRADFIEGERGDRAFVNATRHYHGNLLMLVVSEAVEAHDEIRTGRAPDETYYPGGHPYVGSGSGFCAVCDDMPGQGQHGPQKPEGVPSEIADGIIRGFDYANRAGFDVAEIIDEKLTYNATRPFKHGKKF